MADTVAISERTGARYRGLRMCADEFIEMPDDGSNYELIDGLVIRPPGPRPQ